MRKSSKFLTIILALSLAVGHIGPVSAADISAAGGQGSVPVELTAEALTFSVMVPTALPVNVAANGEVSVATDAKIVNNSAGPVAVKGVSVEAQNNWTLADWSSNLAEKKVGTKEFAMELQNTSVATNGSCEAVFDVIAANDNIALEYNAHIAPQSTATTATIANVVFTVGWEEAPTDEYGNPDGTVYTDFTVTADNRAKIGFTGEENENLVIPTTFVGEDGVNYKVTSIGSEAFFCCSSLASVTIGNSVTSIGDYTFNNCSSLTSIEIGNNVISIGNNAFCCCSNLTSVTIPDSVKSIGLDAFNGCLDLASIMIGNSVTSIGNGAFRETSLSSITYKGTTYSSLNEFKNAFNAIEGNYMEDFN